MTTTMIGVAAIATDMVIMCARIIGAVTAVGDGIARMTTTSLEEAATRQKTRRPTGGLTDGKAGTIDGVFLDDEHGLRISIRGHDGRWPISTVKFISS
jgi:hypothetical protein